MSKKAAPLNLDRSLRDAIRHRWLVSFTLDGHHRIAEPHDYGILKGVAKLFFYQVGGTSSTARPIGWKWADLAKIRDLTLLEEHFEGPRLPPADRQYHWDHLIASVSHLAPMP